MITCTFAGHREFYGSKIRDLVDETIESILKKDDTFLFYSGDMGDFDKLCASVVRAAKKRHPNLHITLVAVLPYMMNKVNTNKEYYEEYFDDVLIPAELSGVHYKSAISKRNRWIMQRSDCLIAYVHRDFGGAFSTVKYAHKLNKPVINLAEKEAPQSHLHI